MIFQFPKHVFPLTVLLNGTINLFIIEFKNILQILIKKGFTLQNTPENNIKSQTMEKLCTERVSLPPNSEHRLTPLWQRFMFVLPPWMKEEIMSYTEQIFTERSLCAWHYAW